MKINLANAIRPFHTVAYILKIKDGTSSYLLLRRCSKYLFGSWQMVSGRIEDGETAWQAALREIKEETGLIPNRFYTADIVESFYEVRRDAIIVAPVFVAVIEIDQEIKLSPQEHDDFKWVSFDEAINHLEFSNQSYILTHIEDNFVRKSPNEFFRIY